MARPAQICRGRSQCPAPAVDASLSTYLFKLAIAEIMKQILSPAILGIFETVGHNARGRDVPKIDVFGIVSAYKKVQQPVAVVIEPDCRVRVDPRGQASLLGYARESVTLIVVKQLRTPPLDQK